MGSEIDLTLAFMAGLLGSGHCIGMCGSLVSAFFMRMAATRPEAAGGPGGDGAGTVVSAELGSYLPYFSYHGARIASYALIGTLAALVGLALTSTGIIGKAQGILQILAGGIVILLGLDILGLKAFQIPFLRVPVNLFRSVFLKASEKGPVAGAAVAGTMNGFMPCALTLAIAVKATTATAPWGGTLIMLAFGLGTLPAMLFVSLAFGKLGTKIRGWLLKAAALFVIGLGISTLYQGLRFFNVMKDLPNW